MSRLVVVSLILSGLLGAGLLLSPSVVSGKVLDQLLSVQQGALPHDGPGDDHNAMHDACVRGDWGTMEREMDRVHPDWRDHHGSGNSHMSSGRSMHGSSGGGMMGGGM